MDGVKGPAGELRAEGVLGPEPGPNGDKVPGALRPEGVAGVIPRLPSVGVRPESWRFGVPGPGVMGVVAPERATLDVVLRKGTLAMLNAGVAHC